MPEKYQKTSFWILIFSSFALLYSQAQFIHRSESGILLGSFAVLYALFGLQFLMGKNLHWQHWVVAAVLLRLSTLGVLPWLSDDYFRFIWDGILQTEGINPYAAIPIEILDKLEFGQKAFLLENMNSPEFHSVYPPFCQMVFLSSAYFSFGNIEIQVLLLKISILLLECGSIFFLLKLLKSLQIPLYFSLLYLLHPFVIVELTGNIHFEAGMIFSCLAAFYFLRKKHFSVAGIFLSMAICFKLWPVLFLPPLFIILQKRKAIQVSAIALLATFLAFLPFYFPELLNNFSNSLGLYFNYFEFHAGVYQWGKTILDQFFVYEVRQEIMAYYKLFPLLLMGLFLWKYRNLKQSGQWLFLSLGVLSIYIITSSVIQPWYIIPLLVFGILYRIYFPLFWSLLIPLTYLTYRAFPYAEIHWMNTAIHLALLLFIVIEFRRKTLVNNA